MIGFTKRAAAALTRSYAAARRLNPEARLRLVGDPDAGVRFELVDAPVSGDEVIEHDAGFTLFVEAGLTGTVDAEEPHDRLVLRPFSHP